MIRFFQSAFPSRLLALFLLALALWFPSFFRIEPVHAYRGYNLYSDLIQLIPAIWEQKLIAFILFFVSALILNSIGTKTGLTLKNSHLAAFIFIVVAASTPFLTKMSPFLLANFVFILFLQSLFRLQNSGNPISGAFNAGLILGVSALIFPVLLFLFVFIWFALIVYRIGKWRPYAVGLLGTFFPYFILIAVFYLIDKPIHPFSNLFNDFSSHPGYLVFNSIYTDVVVGLLSFWVLLAAVQMASAISNRSIYVRQHILVNIWSLSFVVLILLFFNSYLETTVLLTGPASLMLAAFLSQLNSHKWANRILGLFIVLIFINQIFPLLYAA